MFKSFDTLQCFLQLGSLLVSAADRKKGFSVLFLVRQSLAKTIATKTCWTLALDSLCSLPVS